MSPSALVVALCAVVALGGAACARSEPLGPQEAVEVMVLDGVDRGRAACIVSSLDGRLDLAKVTGLTVELTDDELGLLSRTSATCAPLLGTGGGVVGATSPVDDPTVGADTSSPDDLEIDDVLVALVGAGVDADLAPCVTHRLRTLDAPADVIDDVVALAPIIVDCREELETDAGR